MGRRTRISEQRLTGWLTSPRPYLLLLLSAAVLPSPTALSTEEPEFAIPELRPAQTWTYTWKTSGLLSLLFPDSGVGRLVLEAPLDGSMRAELRVDAEGEPFWLTGALIDVESLTAREIWSAYRWHGRVRSRHRQVKQDGVVDMLSTILTLRRDLPQKDAPFEFQAGSTVYPIVARVSAPATYVLEDRAGAGGHGWNKSAEVAFTDDPHRSPQHIALIETLIRIDLELVGNGD